jgi:hypothetical protein
VYGGMKLRTFSTIDSTISFDLGKENLCKIQILLSCIPLQIKAFSYLRSCIVGAATTCLKKIKD